MNYKDFSKEELKKLPIEELSDVAYDALKEYFKLRQQLNQDSTNSSRAPSTDSPEAKARHKAEELPSHPQHGARKQGAQKGHKAVNRPLLPLEEVDIVIDCKPEVCAHCGEPLEGCVDPEPYRQQTYDFEIIRRTTEYRKHRIECPHCGETTEGRLPEEAQGSTYGPSVVALLGILTGLYQISRRMAALFINQVLGIPISVGSVSNLEKELTEASKPVMEEIELVAQGSKQGNADETGFGLEKGKRGWLWVLTTPSAVLFRLLGGRGQEYASKLLGRFEGILTSDRWCGYNRYPEEKRQLCWAHLTRDFKAMTETGADGEAIGKGLKKESRAMFRLWHRFRKWKAERERVGVKISMTVLEAQMTPIRKRVKVLLEEGKHRGVCKCAPILKVESMLWTFTKEEGIEPTNNAAERSIRPGVLWKKRSFGVESERGAQYVESMLSIWTTCRCNEVNPLKFLNDLVIDIRLKATAPSIFGTSPQALFYE